MKCIDCGTENKADVKFCVNCGRKFSRKAGAGPASRLFCPNCGRENPPEARFCEACGSQIVRPVVPAQPVPPPRPPTVVSLPSPQDIPVPAPVPAPSKKGIAGWAWMLAGLAVVLIGAGLFYFLKAKPAEAIDNQGGVAGSSSDASQEPGTCKSDEKVLYVEDFQDGTAEDWLGITQDPPFFSVGPASDDSENLVLTVQKPESASGQIQAGPQVNLTPFSNAVLRMRFFIDGQLSTDNKDWFSFNWIFAMQPFNQDGQQVYDSRYQLPIGFNYFEMRRLQQPLTNVSVDRSVSYPNPGKWYSLEVATYQPRTEVWLNGSLVMEYEDPQPLPAGTFGLEAWLEDPGVKLLFDDIAICELDQPYTP